MGYRRLLPFAASSLICLALHSTPSFAQPSDRPAGAEVWDAATGKDVLTLAGHTNMVLSAAFFPDGDRVLTGSGDRTARIWDARTGKRLITIEGTGANGCYATMSSDGSRILTTNVPTFKI